MENATTPEPFAEEEWKYHLQHLNEAKA